MSRDQLRPVIYSFKNLFIMQSKLTIEVDFNDNNKPYIRIIQMCSDDVRDKLLSNFLQSLEGKSTWCKIIYNPGPSTPDISHWSIKAIIPDQFAEESNVLVEQIRLFI